MTKYCPHCKSVLDDNDINYHYRKPHPRCNKAYYCTNCHKVFCWIELLDDEKEIKSDITSEITSH